MVAVALAGRAVGYFGSGLSPLSGSGVPPSRLQLRRRGEGVAAMDVVHGQLRLWWPIGGGKEPLMAYLSQPFLLLFGRTRLALRLYTATLGVIAAAGCYWLGWETFGRRKGQLIPLVAGLGLATAFWHVAYSRIAFRALAMPAVEALALAWLWRALNTRRTGDFIGAGALIGLGGLYLPGRPFRSAGVGALFPAGGGTGLAGGATVTPATGMAPPAAGRVGRPGRLFTVGALFPDPSGQFR